MKATSRGALGTGAFAMACLAALIQPAVGSTAPVTAAAHTVASDQQVSDAYIYLLGRLLVMRQQQLDFKEGMQWNQLVHRKPGAVDWPNPNLDVAYSEAWLAVDERSCTQVSVPKIAGRYYTVQFLNGWGETLANINERTFSERPDGDFAVCLQGAKVDLPQSVQRIDLPVRTARVLTRVELGDDWNKAEQLQYQFSLRPTGTPELPQVPKGPLFELSRLPGVEAFEAAALALEEPDLNPGMEPLQAQVRAIAEQARLPEQRARIDQQIKAQAFADLARAAPTLGRGVVANGWVRPAASGAYGTDYLARTLVDLGGIWANTTDEVNYFRSALDVDGKVLEGGQSYALTFPGGALPSGFARYFWSVTAVNSKTFKVLPNALDRYTLSNQSDLKRNADGSLTLYFGPNRPKDAPEGNWLPTVADQSFRLLLRFYGPEGAVAQDKYFPPALVRL